MIFPDGTVITVTEDDLKLLAGMAFDWDGGIECGGIATDFKRPFGSSGDITIDAQRLLGRPPYDPETGESAMTWEEVGARTRRLVAIVEHIRRRAAEDESLVGLELTVPWRAARAGVEIPEDAT